MANSRRAAIHWAFQSLTRSPSQNEYEYDDFTVPTGVEDDVGGERPEGEQKRKRKKKRRHKALDEEDFDLLRENTGQAVARRKESAVAIRSTKKLKRLKQMGNREDLYSNIQSRLFGDQGNHLHSFLLFLSFIFFY